MRIKLLHLSEPARKLLIGILSIILLFSGFFFNCWHVAAQQWFLHFQHDNESLVVGRMVKSRSDGIFSAGGLNGAGIHNNLHLQWISSEETDRQYSAYFKGLRFDEYSPYLSQTGGQAMFFSLLDRVLPLSPKTKLNSYYMLTSLLSAVALTLVILWFYSEFGFVVMLSVVCSMVFSQWLTVFGRNLWWSLWAFYLPMIAVIQFFRSQRVPADYSFIRLGIIVFIFVSVKCLFNGYEYITTTLVMMVTPFVYYGILRKLSGRQFLKGAFTAVSGSCLAICLSFTILSLQIGSVEGGTAHGVEHIVSSFLKRTYGDAHAFPAVYAPSLKSSAIEVVMTYLRGNFFDANNYFPIHSRFIPRFLFVVTYQFLIGLFLVMSALVLFRRADAVMVKQRQRNIALIGATWFSLFAPLSWFVIFKAHSFIHTHMNFIVWQMPFVFFGFAVCGVAGKILWYDLVRIYKNHFTNNDYS